ncbi:MAG: hypothetical protein IJS62_00510 [Bacteroidales bacterium]|nr:hypothetical protein [Bacteroidales bacterium]
MEKNCYQSPKAKALEPIEPFRIACLSMQDSTADTFFVEDDITDELF